HEASVEMFRKVAELTPGSYRAHADLGRSLLTQRRFKEAIPVLRRSIEIKGSVEVYPDLATAYMRVGRYAES
ncbi:MAG: hypothetical protein GTN89_06535, partial [Acidobacteria bacterium]|nr:hypothetical protein [Acidobacteriota bacterium]NIM62179.1 hypothetical protein [Acidobacteriota bacterium]NIO58973.1 hypothetical protein [Acidobacteriota bacterium]NIQ30019.1 hypothetical protein [Acidobacteriota bacterium]NIQ84785.1 hypothetical protein [Acidobacteriota bacterium]